jgi:hypothetical protein
VGTNIVDSIPTADQKRGGKGIPGASKKRPKDRFGTFICLIGEGERPWNKYIDTSETGTGLLTLNKIWLNDRLVYSTSSGDAQEVAKNGAISGSFTFYNGAQNQTQDPTFVSVRGSAYTSALQGYSYIAFNNLNLVDYGSQYPSVRVEVTSDLPANGPTIVRDVMARCGIWSNNPLIEGLDWAFGLDATGALDVITDIPLEGYVVDQDSTEMRNILADLSNIFQLGLVTDPNSAQYYVQDSTPVKALKAPPLRIRNLKARSLDLRFSKLGTNPAIDATKPWPFDIEPKAMQEIPSSVEYSAADPRKDYEQSVVVARRQTRSVSEPYTVTSNAVIRLKSTAMRIASYALQLGFARAKAFRAPISPDPVNYAPLTAFDFIDSIGSNQSTLGITVANTVYGADGSIEINGYITDSESVQVAIVDDTEAEPGVFDVDLCGQVLVFEGPAITAPTTGNRRTLNVLYAPADGEDNASAAALLVSTDGGTTYSSTPVTGMEVNSDKVQIVSGFPTAISPNTILDTSSVLRVTVPEIIELQSITEEQVYDLTNNLIYFEGVGLMAFQTATLVATNTYDLTGLLWNIGQSASDQAFSAPSEGWLLTGPSIEFPVPNSIPFTSELTVIASDGTDICVPYTLDSFRGLNAAPRPPYALVDEVVVGTSDIRLSWSRGLSQETSVLDVPGYQVADYPNDEADERYHIWITDGTVGRREFVSDTKEYIYTAADQAFDNIDLNLAQWGVAQTGAVQSIDIENEPWRWQALKTNP